MIKCVPSQEKTNVRKNTFELQWDLLKAVSIFTEVNSGRNSRAGPKEVSALRRFHCTGETLIAVYSVHHLHKKGREI